MSSPLATEAQKREDRVHALIRKHEHDSLRGIQRSLAEAVVDIGNPNLPVAKICCALIGLAGRIDRLDSQNDPLIRKLDAVLKLLADDHSQVRDYLKRNE